MEQNPMHYTQADQVNGNHNVLENSNEEDNSQNDKQKQIDQHHHHDHKPFQSTQIQPQWSNKTLIPQVSYSPIKQARVIPTQLFSTILANELFQFYLSGDIFIDLNPKEFSHISLLNKFKSPSLVTDNKSLGELQIDMHSTLQGQSEFLDLAKYFLTQPNKNLHFLGEQLIIHQQRVIQMKAVAAMISTMPLKDEFLDACEISYQRFLASSKVEIKKMIQDSTIKFYKTKSVKINYSLGTYDVSSMTLSSQLLALLGISTEQASSFIMRKGMFDYNFSIEDFTYQLFMLNILNNRTMECKCQSLLKTFDGIELQCITKLFIISNTDNFMTQRMGLHISEFIIVVDYDVSPNMLRQVIEMRKKQQMVNRSGVILENESDWNYAIQYREFLDQFYPDEP